MENRIQVLKKDATVLEFQSDPNKKDLLKIENKIYPIYIIKGVPYIKVLGNKVYQGDQLPSAAITGSNSKRSIKTVQNTGQVPVDSIQAEKFFIFFDKQSGWYLLPLSLRGLWQTFSLDVNADINDDYYRELKENRLEYNITDLIFEKPVQISDLNAQRT